MCKMDFADGGMATFLTTNSVAGANRAIIYGEKGRIEVAGSAWDSTSFSLFNQSGDLVSKYEESHPGTGRQFQALEVERCIRAGLLESPLLPVDETIAIMRIMDQIRNQIGVKYPME
mgnify:FL=1